MIEVKIEGIDAALRKYSGIQKQIKVAAAKSLTFTAEKVQQAERTEMDRVFDRPTPYIRNSVYKTSAKPENLVAVVGIRDRESAKSLRTPASILSPHINSGRRSFKASELRLQRQGFMKSGEYLVPAAGAKLDRFGNISKGQLQQIFSQIGSRNPLGSDNLKTNSTRSRRHVQQAGVMFWSHGAAGSPTYTVIDGEPRLVKGRGTHLPRGVWMRRGGSVVPVMLVVGNPLYRKRFDFYGVGQRTAIKEFNHIHSRVLRAELAKAR